MKTLVTIRHADGYDNNEELPEVGDRVAVSDFLGYGPDDRFEVLAVAPLRNVKSPPPIRSFVTFTLRHVGTDLYERGYCQPEQVSVFVELV